MAPASRAHSHPLDSNDAEYTSSDQADLPRDDCRRRDRPVLSVTGIAQLCALTGVTPRTIRYYETKGVLRSSRSRSGARLFTPDQCDIALAVVLLRRLGVPLSQIIPIMDAHMSAKERDVALHDLLEVRAGNLERHLDEVRSALATKAAGAPSPWRRCDGDAPRSSARQEPSTNWRAHSSTSVVP